MNNRQQIFVNEYLKCWNASEAARRAGYNGRSDQIGHRLLRNVEIKSEIETRLASYRMSSSEVLDRLTEQARNEHGSYIKDDGTVDLPKLLKDGKGHLIKRIKQTKYGPDIEFYDAQTAIELMGKYHNLFRETQVNIEIDYSALTDEQLQRIANGEDPLAIASSPGQSGTGTEAAAGEAKEPVAD